MDGFYMPGIHDHPGTPQTPFQKVQIWVTGS